MYYEWHQSFIKDLIIFFQYYIAGDPVVYFKRLRCRYNQSRTNILKISRHFFVKQRIQQTEQNWRHRHCGKSTVLKNRESKYWLVEVFSKDAWGLKRWKTLVQDPLAIFWKKIASIRLWNNNKIVSDSVKRYHKNNIDAPPCIRTKFINFIGNSLVSMRAGGGRGDGRGYLFNCTFCGAKFQFALQIVVCCLFEYLIGIQYSELRDTRRALVGWQVFFLLFVELIYYSCVFIIKLFFYQLSVLRQLGMSIWNLIFITYIQQIITNKY